MAEKALTAVIQEAYVQGISIRATNDLVKSMGMNRTSKDEPISTEILRKLPMRGRSGCLPVTAKAPVVGR